MVTAARIPAPGFVTLRSESLTSYGRALKALADQASQLKVVSMPSRNTESIRKTRSGDRLIKRGWAPRRRPGPVPNRKPSKHGNP